MSLMSDIDNTYILTKELSSKYTTVFFLVFTFSLCCGKVFQLKKMCYPNYVGVYSKYIYQVEINRVCVEMSELDY